MLFPDLYSQHVLHRAAAVRHGAHGAHYHDHQVDDGIADVAEARFCAAGARNPRDCIDLNIWRRYALH